MDPPEDVGTYLGCEHIVQHEVKLPVERHPFAHVLITQSMAHAMFLRLP